MRAVVTGASGFAGRHLVELLRREGASVFTVDRRGPADLTGNLLDLPLRRLAGDVLFHLAAFSNPSASRGREEEVYAANAELTVRLLREARVKRFVLASSCAVYGLPGRPAREDDLPCPGTPYAASKLCAEALALASGKDVVVLRPFNHTGPGQSEAYVCPSIAGQIARAESLGAPATIRVADLSPRRDFFDVRDMARAYLLAARRGRRGALYNVATGRAVAVGDLARRLARLSKTPVRIVGARGPASLLSGDPSRFRRDVGWAPRIPLDRTLKDLLDSLRNPA
jgi:GDP-4-dehydro-6-deoxy-D-mannose reductase